MIRRKRARARGYNTVEVLMAMTIFAIGASGVIAMQKTAVQANYDARALDVATTLARTWQERLARDAVLWRTPGSLTGTSYLATLVAGGTDWQVPPVPPSLAGNSPAFDLLGRDVPIDDAQMIYCTQVRAQWLGSTNSLLRVEVRVVWPRANAAPMATCTTAVVNTALANVEAMPHVISTVTSLRGNY